MKQRYFLEFSFDGTDYFGWQVQPKHVTVQEKVANILSKLYDTKISLTGCGRTDTGVHARQFFAHFDAPFERTKLFDRLKMMFPEDIELLKIHKVSENAHVRFDATERSYTYCLHQQKNIFKRHYSLALDLKSLDQQKIKKACVLFTKYNDYTHLSKKNEHLDNQLSQVCKANWELKNNDTEAVFHVSANRFLHNQIRRMVGALINVGNGKLSLDELENALKNKEKLKINDTISPHALFLHSIQYPYIQI